MMKGLDYLDRVTASLSQLPGIGRRSAERMAYRLAGDTEGLLKELVQALAETAQHVRLCARCGGVTTTDEPVCKLCTASNRDGACVCVVQDPTDIIALERTGSFRGRYHALMGKLSPMHGEGPADLRLDALLSRVAEEHFQEVVLALGTDVESEATASYVSERLKGLGVRVTRLATGIPAGSGIMYSDALTLSRAMKGRQEM